VRLIVSVLGLGALLGAGIAAYYVISYAVLWLVGKALPLTGRRRR
jgi:hypothetical protein